MVTLAFVSCIFRAFIGGIIIFIKGTIIFIKEAVIFIGGAVIFIGKGSLAIGGLFKTAKAGVVNNIKGVNRRDLK